MERASTSLSSSTAQNLSRNLATAISFSAAILGILYFSAALWVLNYSRFHPRNSKRDLSRSIQRYAPFIYGLLVLDSLANAACSIWLLVMSTNQRIQPFESNKTGLLLILTSSCWTMLTAGTFTILFIHPKWSTHPIASIGSQTIWLLLTLSLWITGVTLLACELPSHYLTGSCASFSYCGQSRALFGLSVLEVAVLAGCMIAMFWIVRQSICGLSNVCRGSSWSR